MNPAHCPTLPSQSHASISPFSTFFRPWSLTTPVPPLSHPHPLRCLSARQIICAATTIPTKVQTDSGMARSGEDPNKVVFIANHSSADGRAQTATVAPPSPFPPPQPQIGSPLLWIGVGVGISIIFSWAARKAQSYAMQQAFKSMMQQSGQGANPFMAGPGGNLFSGQDFSSFAGQGAKPFNTPFPPPPAPEPRGASTATVDVTPNPVSSPVPEAQVTAEEQQKVRKPAFTDVDVKSLEEQPRLQEQFPQQAMAEKVTEADQAAGATDPSSFRNQNATTENGKNKSFLSMEMLDQMLDDPNIQKMVLPYLPAEMRDPATFKRMIQLPIVRQQLQEVLNNMSGEEGMDMLKYMNSDAVKQQFDQIGMTPEEVVQKILARPDIAASLQNPRVVEAIMDCSQNPINITKYQNDKEVMDALTKISELFPGTTSSRF